MDRKEINPTNLEILIVDDDKIVSFLHGKVLDNFKINSNKWFFPDGKRALEFIEEHPMTNTSFLVLLDLQMPVMNGWEFLDSCRELKTSARINVIVVTSSVNNADLYRALEYKNVLGFSSKPLTRDSLKSLLEFPAIKELFLEMEYEALENDTW